MDMFVDGAWRRGASGQRMDVVNPVDGKPDRSASRSATPRTRTSPCAPPNRALPGWSATPVAERARLQHKAARAMREHADELGRLLTRELGRPLPAAIVEIQRSAEFWTVTPKRDCGCTPKFP